MRLLYLGFSQIANVRHYRFEGVRASERPSAKSQKLEFGLNADLSLLEQFRIRLQDGPGLCLHVLTAGLEGLEDPSGQFATYVITRADMSAFTSGRDALEVAKAARRKPRMPVKRAAITSPMRWP